MIGSSVNALIMRLPVLTAWLAMFAKAVTPITSNAENRACTVSTALLRPFILTLLADLEMLSRALLAPGNFNFSFKRSRVPIVVLTLFSKFRLSNCMETTLSSIVLLIL